MASEQEASVQRDRQFEVREDQAGHRDEVALVRETVADKQHETLKHYMRWILWVTVVLTVLGMVSLLRSFVIQDAVNDLYRHTDDLAEETEDAKQAAVSARDTLTKALEEFEARRNSPDAVPSAEIREALIAVGRIEQHLCGGRCDEQE